MGALSRLKAIEKRLGINLPCAICHGEGSHEFLVVSDEHQVVEPKGCLGCGKCGVGVKIILELDEPVTAGGRS